MNPRFISIKYVIHTKLFFVIFVANSVAQAKVDHVIAVYKDLGKAKIRYSEMGFTIKSGRLHDNGLLNSHIKFPNGTELELMTVQGEPKDESAADYLALLKEKEGGVYVALSGISLDSLTAKLRSLDIEHTYEKGSAWSYITFPKTSSLNAFFFIETHITVTDPPEMLKHKNGSISIEEVEMEGDAKVFDFLRKIGVKYKGKVLNSDLHTGDKFSTPTGDLLIMERAKESHTRPRVNSMWLKRQGEEPLQIIF